jgi:hypothetical protein
VVHGGAVGVVLRLEVEAVERAPDAAGEGLHAQVGVGADEPERLVRGLLFLAGLEQQRRGQGQDAEADIGEPLPSLGLDAQQHVGERRERVVGMVPKHAGGKRRDLEAERFQRVHEEEVVLEAVAAAPAADELLLQGGDIERDRPAEEGIEILEGDRLRVQAVQVGEHGRRGGARPVMADARQIGVEIEDGICGLGRGGRRTGLRHRFLAMHGSSRQEIAASLHSGRISRLLPTGNRAANWAA